MKVSSLSSVAPSATSTGSPATTSPVSFAQMLDSVKSSPLGTGIEGIVKSVGLAVAKGQAPSFQTLLQYQIQVQRFAVQVEAVSKVSEGVSSVAKRLQNG